MYGKITLTKTGNPLLLPLCAKCDREVTAQDAILAWQLDKKGRPCTEPDVYCQHCLLYRLSAGPETWDFYPLAELSLVLSYRPGENRGITKKAMLKAIDDAIEESEREWRREKEKEESERWARKEARERVTEMMADLKVSREDVLEDLGTKPAK